VYLVFISLLLLLVVYLVPESKGSLYIKNLSEDILHREDVKAEPTDFLDENPSFVFSSSTEYVVFAFDGSKSNDMWKETRDFARDMKSRGKEIHFTYFINPIYLLTKEEAALNYTPPEITGFKKGASAIGYAESDESIKERIENIRGARGEGHEIGSHTVGHWNGANWKAEDWEREFSEFDKIFSLKNVLDIKNIAGFRAPELGINKNIFDSLHKRNYLYDSSLVGFAKDQPKIYGGIWQFPVKTIIFGENKKSVLAMDYSIYMTQTHAVDRVRKGTKEWERLYAEVYTAYLKYFYDNYRGNKAPVFIAHHFSKWNDGLYFEVMKNLAEEVCGKTDVKCISYKELAQVLNKQK
jgi:peptidoglycan/xylan/chitin deacetylase (PgdA/CDA1 family)